MNLNLKNWKWFPHSNIKLKEKFSFLWQYRFHVNRHNVFSNIWCKIIPEIHNNSSFVKIFYSLMEDDNFSLYRVNKTTLLFWYTWNITRYQLLKMCNIKCFYKMVFISLLKRRMIIHCNCVMNSSYVYAFFQLQLSTLKAKVSLYSTKWKILNTSQNNFQIKYI